MSNRPGKRALMVAKVRAAVADGKRVLVVTPDGHFDGERWLAEQEVSGHSVGTNQDPSSDRSSK